MKTYTITEKELEAAIEGLSIIEGLAIMSGEETAFGVAIVSSVMADMIGGADGQKLLKQYRDKTMREIKALQDTPKDELDCILKKAKTELASLVTGFKGRMN